MVVLAIIKNTKCDIKLIACQDIEDAKEQIETMYNQICNNSLLDYHNTYYDKDSGYAQIVSGLEQTEFRIGCVQYK